MDRKRIIAGGSVIIILIIVLVYALVHSSSPAPAPKPAPVVHPKTATTQNKPASPQAAKSNGSTGAAGSTGQQSLSDTGPGAVAVVFVVASVIGYAVYSRRLLRRIS